MGSIFYKTVKVSDFTRLLAAFLSNAPIIQRCGSAVIFPFSHQEALLRREALGYFPFELQGAMGMSFQFGWC